MTDDMDRIDQAIKAMLPKQPPSWVEGSDNMKERV
jgi:hypothetical protein